MFGPVPILNHAAGGNTLAAYFNLVDFDPFRKE